MISKLCDRRLSLVSVIVNNMAKRLQKYVKYTTKELDFYTTKEGSCVSRINTNLHLSIAPYALGDFRKALLQHITVSKVGYYNRQLDGIVLDIKNIKVLGTSAGMRFDDPKIHIDISADCYIFRPVPGAVLSGIVKHISTKHVGVVIYRVFNATIRFFDTLADGDVEIDKEVNFRIKDFDMMSVFPYIEGELVIQPQTETPKRLKKKKCIKENGTDSGIEEKESTNELLDELISLIKEEPVSDNEQNISIQKKKKSSKRKRLSKISGTESDKDTTSSITSAGSKKMKKRLKENSEDLEFSVKEEFYV